MSLVVLNWAGKGRGRKHQLIVEKSALGGLTAQPLPCAYLYNFEIRSLIILSISDVFGCQRSAEYFLFFLQTRIVISFHSKCLPCLLRLTIRTSDPLSETRKRDLNSYFAILSGRGRCLLSQINRGAWYKWDKFEAFNLLLFTVLGEISR